MRPQQSKKNGHLKQMMTCALTAVLLLGTALVTVNSQSNSNRESAEGEGKLINEDGSRSRFSFSARRNPNGKLSGQATLRNPLFKAENGQDEVLKIEISCLKVVGRWAIFSGTTKRKSNQTNIEAAYFAVEDGEETGEDKIFRRFFFDDDPTTKGEPELCRTLERETLVFEPISEGEIKVKR